MTDFDDDRNCFVCGPGNGAGLRLVFRPATEGQSAEAEVVFPAHLQGWKGTVHGGLLATVLDEVMVQAAMLGGVKCVTAEMTVRYKRPAATGVPYRVSGRVLASRGRILQAEASLLDASGEACAQASGKLFKV
jgi:uncharacterized protein (TIGR00369 family)